MLAFGHYTDDDTASAIKMRDYKDATDLVVPVAYSIREDAKANNFSATETDTALCLNGLVPSTQSHHAQIFIAEPQPPYVFDGTRHDDFRMDTETVPTLKQRMGTGGGQVPMLAEPIYSFDTQFGSNAAVFEDTSPTLKSSQQPPSVSPPGLAVRRLTPLECERLMGWPDDHTRWTADGKEQADTNRYKQCGNGVASCVARWVGEQLRPVLET
jgi:DNA (cytosine-5)-methyltransferase 1